MRLNIWPWKVIRKLRCESEYWHDCYVKMAGQVRHLEQYAPRPKCKHCGGSNLDADPAGYYCDADTWDGAPLLCVDCANKENSATAAAACRKWAQERAEEMRR